MFLAFLQAKQIPHTSLLGIILVSVSIQTRAVVKSEFKTLPFIVLGQVRNFMMSESRAAARNGTSTQEQATFRASVEAESAFGGVAF
jgi:hypothetical protein